VRVAAARFTSNGACVLPLELELELAPPLDAPPLDAPPLDAPPLDAPPLDAPPLDVPGLALGEPEISPDDERPARQLFAVLLLASPHAKASTTAPPMSTSLSGASFPSVGEGMSLSRCKPGATLRGSDTVSVTLQPCTVARTSGE
jgi:hypothetical protein